MTGELQTRFKGWRRGPAIAILLALLAALVAACWSPETAPAPRLRSSATQPSDLQLYRDIIAGMQEGGGYYEVAAETQRSLGYPLKPFTTFRLPTQATIYSIAGERIMIVVLWGLCVVLMLAWWRRLRDSMSLPMIGAVLFLMAGGLGGMLQPVTGFFHECWSALFLALMLALYRPGRAAPAILAGAAALMVRELALPMILAMSGLALIEKRWREAAGWAAVVAVFAVYLALHAHWVSEVVLPGDKSSPGWTGLNGPQFALKAIAKVTWGIRMPTALASGLLVLSLFGWFSVRAGWALRAGLMLLGYGLLLTIFARTDTFYWALMTAPLAYVGLAFLPRAFTDLAEALRRVPQRAA